VSIASAQTPEALTPAVSSSLDVIFGSTLVYPPGLDLPKASV
jgi:hypothetical protein